MPVPSQIKVTVKSKEIVAMVSPMVFSLADRLRQISSVWEAYFFPGRLSK